MAEEPIRIKIKEKNEAVLLGHGLSRLALTVKPFNLRPSSFTATIEGLKPKEISAEQQMVWFKQLLSEPFQPWTFCISSEPNDRMARAVAAYVMQHVLNMATRYPQWHEIVGGFENKIISDDFSRPSMLILANVLPNSTPHKMEKLRDILVKHESIPKIVVTSGQDPFTFITKNMYHTVHGCLYLKTALVKGDVI